MKRCTGNTIVSVVAFFVIFFAFSAFAIDFAYVLAVRAKLQSATDATALVAVSLLDAGDVNESARAFFNYQKVNVLSSANINTPIDIKRDARAIRVETFCHAPTFFLRVLGVGGVRIQARSSAKLVRQVLEPEYPQDHHIEYTLPSALVVKSGDDFEIKTSDRVTKYLVFVGLKSISGQTGWLDVSCAGAVDGDVKRYNLSNSCIRDSYDGNISSVKFIRVVNDDITVLPADFELDELAIINISQLIKNSDFRSL